MTQHETKRSLLDAAFSLFMERGYGAVTVQDLIDAVGIAKGTFYHHFKSKEEVLEALADQMMDQVLEGIGTMLAGSHSRVIDKLNRMFQMIRAKKEENSGLFMVLARAQGTGTPALPMETLFQKLLNRTMPFWEGLVRQGVREGVFTSVFPQHLAGIVARTVFSFLFSFQAAVRDQQISTLYSLAGAYNEALERLLGLSPGQLQFQTAIYPEQLEKIFTERTEERHG